MTGRTKSERDFEERCKFGCDLARRVGSEALAMRQRRDGADLEVEAKGAQDFVTVVDRMVEDAIRSALARAYPSDGFIGEETGGFADGAGTWVVDPIDGTMNFIHGFRHWGVSLAYVVDGRVCIGVVYDAPHDQLFWAIRGRGAFRDHSALRARKHLEFPSSIAVLGVAPGNGVPDHLKLIAGLQDAGVDYRRYGAAALGLVRVAEGTAEAYYEGSINCWDALAGLLIASEAGATVLALPVEEFLTTSGPILCGTDELVRLIRDLSSNHAARLTAFNSSVSGA